MPLEGEYEPSTEEGVREQVERYEATGGREANTLRDTGLPVAVFSTRGAKSGKVRKQPLMRVEHDGAYLMVGSQGGAPRHPAWVANLRGAPGQGPGQEGAGAGGGRGRGVGGRGADVWWERAVAAYPSYADYQK